MKATFTLDEPRWISVCCGAPEGEHLNRDTGFCPQCHDHTDFELEAP